MLTTNDTTTRVHYQNSNHVMTRSSIKADITFGQLLEISPIARKTLKEGMPVVKRIRKAMTRIAARAQLSGGPCDVKAVKIEAMIVDKVVPNVLVNGAAD